jgi:hypothetical protein
MINLVFSNTWIDGKYKSGDSPAAYQQITEKVLKVLTWIQDEIVRQQNICDLVFRLSGRLATLLRHKVCQNKRFFKQVMVLVKPPFSCHSHLSQQIEVQQFQTLAPYQDLPVKINMFQTPKNRPGLMEINHVIDCSLHLWTSNYEKQTSYLCRCLSST